jgi:hypothetical protein
MPDVGVSPLRRIRVCGPVADLIASSEACAALGRRVVARDHRDTTRLALGDRGQVRWAASRAKKAGRTTKKKASTAKKKASTAKKKATTRAKKTGRRR